MVEISDTSIPVIGSFYGGLFHTKGQPSIESVNPSKPSEVVAHAIASTAEQANEAIESAQLAQRSWASLSGAARGDYLYRWAEQIQGISGQMAEAVAREVGKPIGEAKGEVGRCVAILRYYASESVRESGSVIPGLVGGSIQYSQRIPLGVVGLITPWNFPVAIPLWKAAPALALGNTVVLKPAETSLLCSILLAETAKAAGIPDGVFNVLVGDGPTLGSALMNHAAIRGVSFTGSAKVGAYVAETCARRNVKFQTEMGGKNAGIVLSDANLKQAANLVAGGAMRFAGQKCTATSRVIVVDSVFDAFTQELKEAIGLLKVADAMDPNCAIGPVITEQSQQRIEKALAEAGKPDLTWEAPGVGYFVKPSVYLDVQPDSPLAQTELFGPVLGMLRAKDLDHAIEIANGVEFGLSASLFTKDLSAAMQYITRIEAGLVRVNADTTGVDPHAPFGGVKGSSSGTREQGPAAKDFYTEIKTIQINP